MSALTARPTPGRTLSRGFLGRVEPRQAHQVHRLDGLERRAARGGDGCSCRHGMAPASARGRERPATPCLRRGHGAQRAGHRLRGTPGPPRWRGERRALARGAPSLDPGRGPARASHRAVPRVRAPDLAHDRCRGASVLALGLLAGRHAPGHVGSAPGPRRVHPRRPRGRVLIRLGAEQRHPARGSGRPLAIRRERALAAVCPGAGHDRSRTDSDCLRRRTRPRAGKGRRRPLTRGRRAVATTAACDPRRAPPATTSRWPARPTPRRLREWTAGVEGVPRTRLARRFRGRRQGGQGGGAYRPAHGLLLCPPRAGAGGELGL